MAAASTCWSAGARRPSRVPVIVITARGAVEDRLAGLDGGADDFVVKPFATAELVSRIRAVLRRAARQASERWTLGALAIEPRSHRAARAAQPLELSPREFQLLLDLARDAGRGGGQGRARAAARAAGRPGGFRLDRSACVQPAPQDRRARRSAPCAAWATCWRRMNAALAWWGRMREPTLQRRSVGFVLAGFVVTWLVLLAYAYVQNERVIAREQPFRRFAEAVHRTLEATPDAGQAAAIVRATVQWVNERRGHGTRFPPWIDAELLDASGARVRASPLLQAVPGAAWRAGDRVVLDGRAYRLYETRGPLWTLRIADPQRTTASFLTYNASFILEYLLLALPFVVVPGWWSVRSGLRPLARFAESLKRRRQGDLGPLEHPVRHRELKPLSDALDDLLAQLRRKLDRERVFVQDAAHEIRTPLAVVGTQAHVLAHASCPEERRRAQGLLNQAIARASHLAHQLLMLATLDGEARVAPRHVDVAQAVRELLAQLAPAAMERRMELSLEAPDALWLTLDEAALGSIIGNLVDNAIRYGRAGGNVVVSLCRQGGQLVLDVQDDGPGIPQEERARVFERFYRVPGHERPGSGLGLAIVRQAAARLGGEVAVTDGLAGSGIGFRVRLPLQPHPASRP